MADTVRAASTPSAELPRSRLTLLWIRLPAFVRSFIIDAAEGAAATVGVVTLVNLLTAGSIPDAQAQLVVIANAVAVPVIAAFRRRIVPGIIGWLVRTFPRPAE